VGASTIVRIAPLVPSEIAATPAGVAPRPRLASGPSAAPMISGVSAGRPAAVATSARRRSFSVVGTTSAS
jgi:hypothetical protein